MLRIVSVVSVVYTFCRCSVLCYGAVLCCMQDERQCAVGVSLHEIQ